MPNPEQNKCRVFTEDCYNHPDCMKTLKEDKREEKVEELSDLLEKPIIRYIKEIMRKTYKEVTDEEAENLLGNIGLRRFLKNNPNYAQPRTK